ncbi:MAG TPA: response regulator transcription factor [Candidatus Binatia bacterium]|nr:response regulator transcription factor [Candidatus Binatia bacterium]
MTKQSSTVYIVDDNPSVRKALTRLMRSAGYEAKAFASAREFLADGHEAGVACLVLDIRMPGLSGIDLQRELNKAKKILPVVFITGHGDVPMSVQAMKDGAVDFFPKPVKDTVLLKAIEQALARCARERGERDEMEDIRSRMDSLTPREREVLEHIVAGQLNKQVAYDLGTVEKTIKVHRARVMNKMGVDSLAELVRLTERARIDKT